MSYGQSPENTNKPQLVGRLWYAVNNMNSRRLIESTPEGSASAMHLSRIAPMEENQNSNCREHQWTERIFSSHPKRRPKCNPWAPNGTQSEIQDDLYLHSEPDHPFFDIPHAPAGVIKLTPLSGTIRLGGGEHFSME